MYLRGEIMERGIHPVSWILLAIDLVRGSPVIVLSTHPWQLRSLSGFWKASYLEKNASLPWEWRNTKGGAGKIVNTASVHLVHHVRETVRYNMWQLSEGKSQKESHGESCLYSLLEVEWCWFQLGQREITPHRKALHFLVLAVNIRL